MNDGIKKELRRQIAHASGIVLLPTALLFGKFLVGIASLVVALVIFILAEHRNNNNNTKSIAKKNAHKSALRYGMKKNSKQYADKSVPIQTHSVMNSIHIVFERFERSGGNYRGAFYFYLASAVSLFIFPQSVALLSITVLALGDSFSTAVGIFGKRKIFYNRKKTWEGTLAGFAASFAGCFLISPYLALPAAFIGMLVESLPLKIDDNLTIPILTGIVLSAIMVF